MAHLRATRSLGLLADDYTPGTNPSPVRAASPHGTGRGTAIRPRLVRLAASGFLIAALLGCATGPTPEFLAYQAAFREGAAASAAMVAIYEPLEIAQHAVTVKGRPDFDAVYDPDEARWFAPGGRGLVSEQIERGFGAIETYNTVLALYVTGESFSLIEPRLRALAAETAALAAFAGLPGLTETAGATLITALGAVARAADEAQFEEAVRANSGQVLAFLDALRAATRTLWSNAVNAIRQREVEALRAGGDFDGLAARADFRAALDAWVMSLDAMREATDQLQTAVISDSRSITLEELATFAAQIRTHSEEARLAARAVARGF